jgi:hypothetical protein
MDLMLALFFAVPARQPRKALQIDAQEQRELTSNDS